ncbi:MAG: chromosome segregation protein SMC [Lactobacillaceae bacterium]|jgi:chromosome segregation protein|nr:chromosome segregation protein SMC [Lactobacillaceae bacterium]
MKLKSIEINGFKSFADKTVIEFQDGLTGIVGPNGSGKSNVIEAIRWVMGEQSAKGLRGDKMVDVIFGGSKNRNAMSRASVTMNIDNSDHFLQTDYNEVEITRRLYRNGDSEYLINGVKSRLKDISDLFMDTGLGRESFSIINQGKVETIFNAKPEERRAIIEDVAGVYKYKKNKERTENELKVTSENLERLADIIAENESRLDPLRKQAEEAKVFQSLQVEHDNLNLVRNIRQLNDSQNQVKEFENNLIDEKSKLMDLENSISEITEKRQQNSAEISNIENQINQLSVAIESQTGELERTKGDNLLRNNQLETLQNEKARLSNEVETFQARLDELNDILSDAKSQIESKTQALNQTQNELDTYYQESGQSQRDIEAEKLANLREEYMAKLVEITSFENEIKTYQRDNEKVADRLNKLDERTSSLEEQIESTKLELAEFGQDGDELDYQTLQNNVDSSLQSLNQKKEQLNSLTGLYNQNLNQFNQDRARLESLQNSTENSNYYFGVKNILEVRNNFPGLFGTVAELIDIDSKNANAIEMALGAALQNVIVDTEQTAKRAVGYLRDRKLGQVTFLPVTNIKGRNFPQDVLNQIRNINGFIGIASDLVTTDSRFQEIVDNLLGLVIVAKSIDDAFNISRASNRRFNVVTLDGSIVRAGGAITGGATRNQGGLLKRNAEIADLREKVEVESQKVEEARRVIEGLQTEIQNSETQFTEIRNELITKKESIQLAVGGRKLVQDRLNSLNQNLQNEKTQAAELNQELSSNNADLITARAALENTSEDSEKLLAQINTLEANQVSSSKDGVMDFVTEKRTTIATLKAEIQALNTRISETETQIQTVQERLDKVLLLQSENESKFEAFEKDNIDDSLVNQIDGELKSNIQARDDLNELLKQARIERNELSNSNNQEQDQYRKISNSITSLENKKISAETRIEQIQETLRELEYDANTELDLLESRSVQDLNQAVSDLKRELAKHPLVNLGAIEELEHVSERYNFLTTQRDDLIGSIEDLKKAIAELDKEVIEKFAKTFTAVSNQFEKTFPTLFGGGSAQLKLTNPDDMLTTGIDIIVAPPGKKARGLSALSGGEKALTAISLLLSILLVNPVPFAILDETEAALDESKVDTYGRFLAEFGKQTQFIVITHRKPTMKYANVLYGVTMQEPGISTMISITLDEARQVQQ